MRCLYIVHEHQCLCAQLCVLVCGLHMLPITSPICVNHHKRRNRVRHPGYDLKDIREEGEPVTGPARPRSQTTFTHTSFSQFGHTLHWVSCACRFQIICTPDTLCLQLLPVVKSHKCMIHSLFAQIPLKTPILANFRMSFAGICFTESLF